MPVEFTSLSVYFCIREAKIQRNKKNFYGSFIYKCAATPSRMQNEIDQFWAKNSLIKDLLKENFKDSNTKSKVCI